MSDERRTIQINPDFFKLSRNGRSRKNRKQSESKPLKIKTNDKPRTSISTLRKNILSMIRRRQDEKPDQDQSVQNDVNNFKSEFKDSIDFLSSLPKQNENANKTIRNTFPLPKQDVLKQYEIPTQCIQASNPIPIKPNYGCLKNGILPTYRVWKNKTQRQNDPNKIQLIQGPSVAPMGSIVPMSQSVGPGPDQYEMKLKHDIQELSRIEQFKTPEKKRAPEKKRIIRRREFIIGKSKTQSVVSVLVSNKTLRAERNLLSQELKKTSIQEVKKYLLKHGFIKKGTSSPNDVLRKMYESAKLIGGEIQNHNPEIMLHNYFNEENI